jgi:hypothetical protein
MRIEAFLNSHGDEIDWWAMTNPMNVQNPIVLLGFDLFDQRTRNYFRPQSAGVCDPKAIKEANIRPLGRRGVRSPGRCWTKSVHRTTKEDLMKGLLGPIQPPDLKELTE